MATTMSRLQIAERIHGLLLREIDFAIDIERLLGDARYARDVLLVCDAVPGGELIPLAALFRAATKTPPAAGAQAPAAARQTQAQAEAARRAQAAAPPAGDRDAPAASARSERHADSDWLGALGAPRRRAPDRPAAVPGGHARRATDWAQDTSGFGVTQPAADPTVPDVHQAEPAPPSGPVRRGRGRARRQGPRATQRHGRSGPA